MLIIMYYICVPDDLVSCCTSKNQFSCSWPRSCCLISLSHLKCVRNFAFCRLFLPHTLLLLINVIVAEQFNYGKNIQRCTLFWT